MTPYRITWTPRDIKGPFMLMYPIRRRKMGDVTDTRVDTSRQAASTTAGRTGGASGSYGGRGGQHLRGDVHIPPRTYWCPRTISCSVGPRLSPKILVKSSTSGKRNIAGHEVQNSWLPL
eukprot:gnl/Chilomastix_caulleri/4340.p1 GENE.gnl/Chilomastix_caulleri/4340~~gnl/Chilomastix_caulleri/4340.p1  ORF type:complete len:119 (+),score=30.14 gnl/Chilomastix_caulleri/4340:20-376(+)